jgi:hypothetical protein
MEARFYRAVVLAAALISSGASHRSENFIVEAPTDALAREFALAAETSRRELALEWLGQELPRWAQPCPIAINVGENLGAGGATTFMFDRGSSGRMEVFGWRMTVQGTRQRILDSVLPHEVTHTIFATHFRRPLPRWADEGACTTVEHASEKAKQQQWLLNFLKTGRGIPFDKMFAMKEYPRDILPLYAQGFSTARFLIAQGGRQKFVQFLETGFKNENWPGAVHEHYGYADLARLQTTWVDWVRRGSIEPVPASHAGKVQLASAERPAKAKEKSGQWAVINGPDKSRADTLFPADGLTSGGATAASSAAVQPERPLRPISRTPVTAIAGNQGSSRSWYVRQDALETAASRGVDPLGDNVRPANKSRDVARPQGIEQPREVILEWTRAEPPNRRYKPRVELDASVPTDTIRR